MNFNKINFDTWKRKEYFKHYFTNVPCTYSMTVNIEISKLLSTIKTKNIKLYPVMIYCISKVINNHIEFKMNLDKNKDVGYYDKVNPSYTIFNKDTETFSSIWTNYSDDFDEFYNECLSDINKYKTSNKFCPKENIENVFNISCIPWASFTSFNLNLQKGYDYLPPIITIGRYFSDNMSNNVFLPVNIQVHHAVCDGYHTSRFFNELQDLINNIVV